MENNMKAEIYTRDNCNYCEMAKKLMEDNNIEYTEIKITEDVREPLIERITLATRTEDKPDGIFPRTIPQIFLEGEYVGGYTELNIKLSSA